MIKRLPVPNHPDLWQTFLGIFGGRPSKKERGILVWRELPKFSGWCWYYRRANGNQWVYIGPVERFRSFSALAKEIRVVNLVSDLY